MSDALLVGVEFLPGRGRDLLRGSASKLRAFTLGLACHMLSVGPISLDSIADDRETETMRRYVV